MKVLAINGSARKDGNTSILVNYAAKELQKEGIEVEVFNLQGKKIHGCIACYKCFNNKDKRCSVDNDILNECISKINNSEGTIIASPTYFGNVTTEIKALIDRAGFVSIANGYMYKRKLGAAVVAVRAERQSAGHLAALSAGGAIRGQPPGSKKHSQRYALQLVHCGNTYPNR